MMSDYFELGGESEIVKLDLFSVIAYYVKSGTRIENRRAFVLIKQIHLLFFN